MKLSFKTYTHCDPETGAWKIWIEMNGVVVWRRELDPTDPNHYTSFEWGMSGLVSGRPRGISQAVRRQGEQAVTEALAKAIRKGIR